MYPIGQYQAGNLATQGGVSSPPPPLPPFDNIAACWGLFNFNNDGYPDGTGVTVDGVDNSFLGAAPYPLDWDAISSGNVDVWWDQSGTNPLTQSDPARPILDATNQLISFDGTQWLTGSSAAFNGQTGTGYFLFRADDLMNTGYLFAQGRDGVADGAITAKMVAGVLTVSVTTSTLHLLNTKIKTITDSNWHLLTVIVDMANADPASQVVVLLDNSTSGVSAPLSSDLSTTAFANTLPILAARNESGTLPIACDYRLARIQTNADTLTQATAMWTYIQFLQTQSP